MSAGRILWTGKPPLNGGHRSRPESERLRDGQVKSMVFALVLAWRCLHDTRCYALSLWVISGHILNPPPESSIEIIEATSASIFDVFGSAATAGCDA